MARKPVTPRASRHASKRKAEKLRDDLEKLAHLKPGGTPENPIEVTSPVQVDARARTTACPLCGGSLELDEHVAETVDGQRLRIARCHCLECGVARQIYFHLQAALQS